jgi:hypothetical protein
MSNYMVIREPNGTFTTHYVIQDGTETGNEKTLEEAIRSVIKGAKVMNGTTITEDDVQVGTRRPVNPVPLEVVWDNEEMTADEFLDKWVPRASLDADDDPPRRRKKYHDATRTEMRRDLSRVKPAKKRRRS